MKEKEVKARIDQGIREGIPKSELFDELKNSYEEEPLRRLLAARPCLENREKYKVAHFILSIIWGLFIALEFIGLLDLFNYFDLRLLISVSLSAYITLNIWRFDAKFFLPGMIWLILSIFNAFKEAMSISRFDPDYEFLRNLTLGYIIVLLAGTFLMYYLKSKVFSYYKWFAPEKNYRDESYFEAIKAPQREVLKK